MPFFYSLDVKQKSIKKNPYGRKLNGYKEDGRFIGEFCRYEKQSATRKNQRIFDYRIFIQEVGLYQFGNSKNNDGFKYFYLGYNGTFDTYVTLHNAIFARDVLDMQIAGAEVETILKHISDNDYTINL